MRYKVLDLWLPCRLSRHLGLAPVPMAIWFRWHAAFREQIEASRLSKDTFTIQEAA